jgi:integrase
VRRRSGVVERRSDGTFRVRARIDGKLKTLATGIATEAEARDIADAAETVRRERDGELPSLDLSAYGRSALDRREVAGIRGVAVERQRWGYVARHSIGTLPVGAVRRVDVQRWLDELEARGLAAQTLRNALNLLRAVLQDGVERGHAESNVAREVRVKRRARASLDELGGVLRPEEQQALIAAVPELERPTVLFAMLTGLRQAEQWHLRWDDVQADCSAIIVRRSRGDKAPKNGRPRRQPCMPLVRKLLEELPRSAPWVFATERGCRRDYRPPDDWHQWVRDAGINRRIRWHDLRHTCATSLLAGWWGERWPLEEVRRYLGHSSVQVTERYARLLDDGAYTERVSRLQGPGGPVLPEFSRSLPPKRK